jgi:predicted phage baseplate assembly protein
MPLDIPTLDDRRWADLVEDARALIPRVAPRWTDHNVHDPGITFIELFAWLAEMQIYQLDRVGEKHRETFARLAGTPRRDGIPARVQIRATRTPAVRTVIAKGTQLVPLEGDEIVFETDQEIQLTRSQLLRIVVNDGSRTIDQTEANSNAGVAFLPFGEQAPAGAHLRLGFDRFYPDEESTLRLTVDVFTADLDARCGIDAPVLPNGEDGRGPGNVAASASAQLPVELAWEYLGPANRWLPLEPRTDGTYAFTRSGVVTLPVARDAVAVRDAIAMRDYVWIRCRIVRGSYDIEPRLSHVGVNGLICVQQNTVQDELLGRGNGRPDQSLSLASKRVLITQAGPSLELEVNGKLWQRVTSFDDAEPDSEQYVLDPQTGTVLFGNGLNGRVPMPDQDIRARLYRTTSGATGNVAKNLEWKFKTAIVPGVTLKNAEPASGGADPESLDAMELRARAYLSRPHRAVTINDIERLALSTPHAYVARAYAIPDCPVPGRITVVAVPKIRPGRVGPPRSPSDAFLGAVQAYLQQRRLLCDDLRIIGPVYVEVRVGARLRLAKGAGSAAVIERARRALQRFFDGEDLAELSQPQSDTDASASACPTSWPFGRPVFPSEVYAVLDGVQGVDAVSSLRLTALRGDASVAPDATGAIVIPRIGLVYSGAHQLAVDAEAGKTR